MISGGKATEHPDVARYLEMVLDCGCDVVLVSNGVWIDDAALWAKILRPGWTHLHVQVINDPRFYPRRPSTVSADPWIC